MGKRPYQRSHIKADRAVQEELIPGTTQEEKHLRKPLKASEKKRYGIEYRVNPNKVEEPLLGMDKWSIWKWYKTEEDRDKALQAMTKKDDLFMYRGVNR